MPAFWAIKAWVRGDQGKALSGAARHAASRRLISKFVFTDMAFPILFLDIMLIALYDLRDLQDKT
jgi:hypothetical protein